MAVLFSFQIAWKITLKTNQALKSSNLRAYLMELYSFGEGLEFYIIPLYGYKIIIIGLWLQDYHWPGKPEKSWKVWEFERDLWKSGILPIKSGNLQQNSKSQGLKFIFSQVEDPNFENWPP